MNRISLADGRDFAWRSCGSGPPLILIHGWGSSSSVFARLMAELTGYQSLAPDLPGYGSSAPAVTVDLDSIVDDLIDWLDALDLNTFNILGWSLGGMIAQRLAVRSPQRVNRLILVASTPRFVTSTEWSHGLVATTVRALARDFRRSADSTLRNFWTLQFQGEEIIPLPILPELERNTALEGLELLCQLDMRREVSRVIMPTLVLHGSADVIIPVGASHFLAEALPDARLHVLAGRGHAPFLSATNEVSAAIRSFLL